MMKMKNDEKDDDDDDDERIKGEEDGKIREEDVEFWLRRTIISDVSQCEFGNELKRWRDRRKS